MAPAGLMETTRLDEDHAWLWYYFWHMSQRSPYADLWENSTGLASAVEQSDSITDVLRRLGIPRNKSRVRFVRDAIKGFDLDTSHFRTKKKYTDADIAHAVAHSATYTETMQRLGMTQTGGTHVNLVARIKQAGISTGHFTSRAWARGRPAPSRRSAADILVAQDRGRSKTRADLLRRALLEVGAEEACSVCHLGTRWHGKPLQLQVDHINGDRFDHREENLRFICPNCHSQTPTFGSRNRKDRKG